jgi:hypothetical protein
MQVKFGNPNDWLSMSFKIITTQYRFLLVLTNTFFIRYSIDVFIANKLCLFYNLANAIKKWPGSNRPVNR